MHVIVQYLNEGMHFIGVCAGAFCGLVFLNKMGNFSSAHSPRSPFKWDPWNGGYGVLGDEDNLDCSLTMTPLGRSVFGLSRVDCFYHHGALTTIRDGVSGSVSGMQWNAKILANFDRGQRTDLGRDLGGKSAIVMYTIGPSTMILFAPHFIEWFPNHASTFARLIEFLGGDGGGYAPRPTPVRPVRPSTGGYAPGRYQIIRDTYLVDTVNFNDHSWSKNLQRGQFVEVIAVHQNTACRRIRGQTEEGFFSIQGTGPDAEEVWAQKVA